MKTSNKNLRYCLAFLRNGGERLRAIRLLHDITGMDTKDAVKFVDTLHERVPLAGTLCELTPQQLSAIDALVPFDAFRR